MEEYKYLIGKKLRAITSDNLDLEKGKEYTITNVDLGNLSEEYKEEVVVEAEETGWWHSLGSFDYKAKKPKNYNKFKALLEDL